MSTLSLYDDFLVVHKASIAAALVKLNVNIPIEDVIKAIEEEDKPRCVAEADQRRAALAKLTLESNKPTAGVNTTAVCKFVPNPPKPANPHPSAKEHRRLLIELTKQAFPDGNVLRYRF